MTVMIAIGPAFGRAASQVLTVLVGAVAIGALSVGTAAAAYADPPASPDLADTLQGQSVSVPVLANDAAGRSTDPATVRIVDPSSGRNVQSLFVPGAGTWTVGPDGAVTFAPMSSYASTTVPIGYVGTEANGRKIRSWLSVTVIPERPILHPDVGELPAYQSPGDREVSVPVLDNDVAGDPSLPLVQGTLQIFDFLSGTWSIEFGRPGKFTYSADPVGGTVSVEVQDNFNPPPVEYKVADVNGTYSYGSVSSHVETATTARPDTAVSMQGLPVSFHPLIRAEDCLQHPNDVLVDRLLRPGADDYTTDPVVISGEGTWTLSGDGSVTFSPEPGFVGVSTPFDYVLFDAAGSCGHMISTLQVTVTSMAPGLLPMTPTVTKGGSVTVTPTTASGTGSLNLATLRLVNPADGQPAQSYRAPNEGTWSVDPTSGSIRFSELARAAAITPARVTVAGTNGDIVGASVVVRIGPSRAPTRP